MTRHILLSTYVRNLFSLWDCVRYLLSTDTVNHDILLERLDKDIGVRGVTHDWFRSYLSNRCQQVYIEGSLSNQRYLNCCVPQGSCLGPLLFVMHTSTLFKVIEHRLPEAHCYADDTELYLTFKPDDVNAQDEVIHVMEDCIKDIRHWLIEFFIIFWPSQGVHAIYIRSSFILCCCPHTVEQTSRKYSGNNITQHF